MKIGSREFHFDTDFYLMGILNVTPDSFSDGGRFDDADRAYYQAEKLISEGADILDIGGESTRPEHVKITAEEEIERVCPIIEGIKERFDIPVSLDTYKSEVAREGIRAGADMLNDIWGLKWDGTMAAVIAEAGVACCLMHNRHDCNYTSLMEDIIADLLESVRLAQEAGIAKERILLDPGIGFAKNPEENLCVLKHLDALTGIGYPVVLGASRKSVIGLTLGLPVEEREEGTLAITILGRQAGCSVFRVHDVKTNLRGLRMAEAILRAQ